MQCQVKQQSGPIYTAALGMGGCAVPATAAGRWVPEPVARSSWISCGLGQDDLERETTDFKLSTGQLLSALHTTASHNAPLFPASPHPFPLPPAVLTAGGLRKGGAYRLTWPPTAPGGTWTCISPRPGTAARKTCSHRASSAAQSNSSGGQVLHSWERTVLLGWGRDRG